VVLFKNIVLGRKGIIHNDSSREFPLVSKGFSTGGLLSTPFAAFEPLLLSEDAIASGDSP